jgi:UDP-glucose 4-epimerase
MSILVIFGGAGFVGSTLANLVCKKNTFTRVIVVGRSKNPKFELNSKIEYAQGNAIDPAFVMEILKKADYVVDLTYSTVPQTSYLNPLLEVTQNLPACINIMQQCMMQGVKRYLLVSSGGTVYGNTDELIIRESHPTNPISPYGIAKLTMEKYAYFFHKNFNLQVVVARPSNPYGLNQIGTKPQGFIGNAISHLLNHRPLTVYGQHGTIRDYIYIEDLAHGLCDCLLYGEAGTAYNVGSGVGFNNIEVIKIIQEIFSTSFKVVNKIQSRPFDVNYNVLDIDSIRKLNGWAPSESLVSGINKIKEELK